MTFCSLRWVRRALCLATLAASPCFGEVRIDVGRLPDAETVQVTQTLRTAIAAQVPRAASLNLRITVGVSALREALEADEAQPTLAIMISSVDFDAVLKERKRPSNLSAIFTNPDPLDQVSLAESLLGRATVGVIDSPSTHALATRLSGRSVQTIIAQPEQDIDLLLRQTTGIDALIVLPDATVLNRANINHVVRTLYQRRAVLIGYSQTLTRVGGLASIYVSADALTAQTVKTVAALADNGTLPGPSFVADVSVAVNEQLAHSLNMALPPDSTILNVIRTRRKERTP